MIHRSMLTVLAAALALTSVGCVADLDGADADDEEALGEASQGVMRDNGINFNGTQINGLKLNGLKLNGLKLNGLKLNGVALNNTDFSGLREDNNQPVSGAGFTGVDADAELIDTSLASVRFDSITPSGLPGLSYYRVKHYTNGQWQNVCADDVDAIPLKGIWNDVTGAYADDGTKVTFACRGAALAKCVEWGYERWATAEECLTPGNCQQRSLEAYHQACVRMVRADYCGDGVAHTSNGTTIDVYDALGIQSETPSSGLTLEAEWGVNGAHCVMHTRWADADGSNPDKQYILDHCPERWAGPENPNASALNCGAAGSTFPTAAGWSTPLGSRRLLRNASGVNLR